MVDSVGLRSGSVRSAWFVDWHVVNGEEGEGSKSSSPRQSGTESLPVRHSVQPDDRLLVPLDNNVGDIELREDLEDVWRRVANVPRLGGVGTNSNPYDDGAESWLLAVLNGREASRCQRRVLETTDLHRRNDLRRNVVPHLIELRAKDTMGSFGRDLEETGARCRDGEGICLKVQTSHELEIPDAMVVEVHLVFQDHIGGYDSEGVRVAA